MLLTILNFYLFLNYFNVQISKTNLIYIYIYKYIILIYFKIKNILKNNCDDDNDKHYLNLIPMLSTNIA
jgi:hypothetical protein